MVRFSKLFLGCHVQVLQDLLNHKLEYEEKQEYRHLAQLGMVLHCSRINCIMYLKGRN